MKRALPRLIATIVLLICGAAIAAPAQAASLPVLYGSDNGFAHVCTEYPDPVPPSNMLSSVYSAIVCADITTADYTSSSGPSYKATAQIEVWCVLGESVIVHCNGADVTGGLYRQSNTSWAGQFAGCANAGCAPTGQRNYFQLNVLTFLDSDWSGTACTDNVDGYTALWSVVQSATVYLPNGDTVNIDPGPGTPHYFVCQ